MLMLGKNMLKFSNVALPEDPKTNQAQWVRQFVYLAKLKIDYFMYLFNSIIDYYAI